MTRKLLLVPVVLLVVLLSYAATFTFCNRPPATQAAGPVTDVARLVATKVSRVERLVEVEALRQAVLDARRQHRKVSIAGSRHSQGGQTIYDDAVVLDMRGFNRVLALDVKSKTIRVQSGATWEQVQNYINPHRLAVKVMQSSYVFTIGGTLSANAHGRDLEKTSVVETVKSFRLLKADGTIVTVSREENPELFKLVIGGYGMFGVILEVELELADDEIYERRAAIVDYQEFPDYFAREVLGHRDVALLLARPSIAPSTLLREIVVTTWHRTDREEPGARVLGEEKNVLRDRFLFGISRKFEWAKAFRWRLQKRIESTPGKVRLVSRNNAMRPPATPLKFLDYFSADDTDIVQEYFIPVRNFVPFMNAFRDILVSGKMNVISFTIRYVKANDETYLSYAPKEDAFALIQMSNVGLAREAQEQAQAVTRRIVDAAVRFGGTYYLTYQLYPTREQLRQAYPNAERVFARKRFYDPDELFMSKFYEKYGVVANDVR